MATHHFTPDHYYTALGTYEPVLRLADGDTVITTTVDSGGADHSGQQVTTPWNPQTGPFSIEGAEPGDTLVVHLDRLWPNRRQGITSTRIAPHVVDPWHVVSTYEKESTGGEWEIDLENGTATLVKPETKLGRLTLPLRPMLGCFGVAPGGGQAISSVTSAEHGGNMDYKGFEQGVTIYFPVFVEGALFFVGDGHALQGDGEIAGTGIEISFDVQFTVSLKKGKRIGWPRGENETHLFTAGNARPLDQALQHATTEMIAWLKQDYGLDQVGVHTLLGQCVEYEVGNVFDPAYTMICKLSKSLLRQIGVLPANPVGY
jgi:amidase